MKRAARLLLSLLVFPALGAASASADQRLVAAKVDVAPAIDGVAGDPAWTKAEPIVTHDPIAGIDVVLKAVYTGDEIFLLARFPDPTEDRDHKLNRWNPELEIYEEGPTREDTFVLKWSMEPFPIDLSLSADNPYKADIWYWKACRTDTVGYADDKMQVYSLTRSQTAKWLLSGSGRTFYLTRSGDAGSSAYGSAVYAGYAGNEVPAFIIRAPDGSRADVHAKGTWRDGEWTIEFRRKLRTGHIDDIQFATAQAFQFGVSRYEIAGRAVDDRLAQPKFGAGDVGETLFLAFQ